MKCNMTFLVMKCHWCQCYHHTMLMASSMKPLHFPGQDNQNEVQHDFFGHVMPLVLESAVCDADNIISHTIALLMSR